MQGIIIENKSNLYIVVPIESKEESNIFYEAKIRGKLKKEDISPVVGDYVEFEVLPREGKKEQAIIEKVLPRKTYIKRPKIANITQMILIISCIDPKPDLLMLDKQLAFAEFLNIKVVIVLNKIDLDQKRDFEDIEKVYKNIGYRVIKTSAKDLEGVEELKKILKNNINVFSGNSGVGKSTLTNSILKDKVTKEGQISKKNKKGKNTTTKTRLYEIEKYTYLADTPGFSTFQISEIKSNELVNCYRDFIKYIEGCRYLDCTHLKEKECAIKNNVENNNIDKNRYLRFCKIYNELKEKEDRKKW